MTEDSYRRLRGLMGASAVLSIALLAGRLSGLWREIELAAAFGLTLEADLAVLLLTLPDLMVNLLLSGGLGAALVPRFRALEPTQSALLLRRAMAVCFVTFATIALVVGFWPKGVLGLLAPGIGAPSLASLPSLAILAVAAAIPLTALAGVSSAWLNAKQKYLVAGIGTLIFNLCVLAFLWISGPALAALGAGIVAGAALRLASQLGAMPGSAWRSGPTQPLPDDQLLRDFFAATLSASLMLLVPVFVRALASTLGGGSIAAFNYALKLVELPVAILLGSIATVALTTLSEQMSIGNLAEAQAAAQRHIQRGVLLAVAVVGIGAGFATPLVHLVLARGAMDAEALDTVASLLRIALLGTPALAVSGIAVAWLNAARRPAVVLRWSGLCLTLLPLLAVPGLLTNSGPLLMGAMVAFQVLLAALLMRAAKMSTFGSQGWLSRRLVGCVALSLGIVAAFVMIDTFLAMRSDALRAALALSGFAVAVFLTLRLSRAAPDPIQHS